MNKQKKNTIKMKKLRIMGAVNVFILWVGEKMVIELRRMAFAVEYHLN